MRNDQLPKHNAESERTPSHRFMDYTPLVTIQDRLDALEEYYGGQYQNDDSIFVPRVARVAPMRATVERGVLPTIPYRPVASIDLTTLHLPNPTATSFSNAAAAAAAAEAAEAAAAASAAATTAAAAAAPTRVAAVHSTADHSADHSAAVRCTTYSAAHATAPSNTATYASPPVSYTTTHPSLYCVASTSNALAHNRGPSTSNSVTAPATSTVNAVAPDHDYDMIPAFRRRALDNQHHDDTMVLRRRALENCDDEEMAEDAVPRKMAKRSEDHITAASSDDNDDDEMDCDP